MEITVNGETRVFEGPISVTALLQDLRIAGEKVAVEHNLEIVPKSAYHERQICDGDRIEIVQFIGGGA